MEKESERTQDQGAGLIRRGGEQESFGAEIAGIHAGAKGEERGRLFKRGSTNSILQECLPPHRGILF